MWEHNCNPYEGGVVPPCSAFLGNIEPIIKDGKVIYRNENRVYCFISTVPKGTTQAETFTTPETTSPVTNTPFETVNVQISLPTFLIGLFINEVQLGMIDYYEDMTIHSDKTINNIIHNLLKSSLDIKADFIPKLSFIVSNSNAILPFYTYALDISPLNLYILFLLNRIEADPGLLFVNNSFVTEDPINFSLAEIHIWFPNI